MGTDIFHRAFCLPLKKVKNFKEKPAGKRVAVYNFFMKVKMHAGIYCAHDLMFRVKKEFPKN